MVDYAAAIKKPFEDISTLAIGVIIGIVSPFTLGLLGLLISGYGVGVGRETLKGNNNMPKWDPGQLVQYIKDVIFVIVISIVYMIPAGILFLIGGLAVAGPIIAAIASGGAGAGEIATGLAAGGIFIILGGLLALIGGLFSSMGVLYYVKENSVGAAFKFGAILKKILTGTYWATLIVMLIYTIVLVILAGLLSIIPIIGSLVGFGAIAFLIPVTSYTMLAQVFKETP